MNAMLLFLIGLAIAYLIITVVESIKIPKARTIQAIMKFKKFYKFIENVEGKRFDHNWKLIDLAPGEKKPWNIHFFLWPFCKTYTYPLNYTKLKKIGEEQPGDIVVWKDEQTKQMIVSRRGVSDHIEFRKEYPTITPNLDTNELAKVNIFTTNIIEAVEPKKMYFATDDYLGVGTRILGGGLKGLVAEKAMINLNQYSSEEHGEFNSRMKNLVNCEDEDEPGLLNFGMMLFKSIFEDFDPADEKAKKLAEAYTDVPIAEQKGKAMLKEQEGASAAYKLKTDTEIGQEKKRRIDTGQAKTDADGKITELVPEANTKVVADNLGQLKDLKGTLVLGDEVNKMLNLNKGGDQ